MKKLYEKLGVAVDATAEQIRKAYRKRAKETHPDAGGKAEEFQELRRAMVVLTDPDKRKRYDETGEEDTSGLDVVEQKARAHVAGMIAQALDQSDGNKVYEDIFQAIITQTIIPAKAKLANERARIERRLLHHVKFMKRVKRKKPGANMIEAMVKAMDHSARQALARNAEDIQINARVLEIMSEYEFEADKEPDGPNMVQFNRVPLGSKSYFDWGGTGA